MHENLSPGVSKDDLENFSFEDAYFIHLKKEETC